jgi:hypothetical protein
LQNVTQDNQSKLTKYQTELSAYNLELTAYSAQFNTSLQKVQLEYNWILAQFKALKQEYEQSIVPFVVQQPQQQGVAS